MHLNLCFFLLYLKDFFQVTVLILCRHNLSFVIADITSSYAWGKRKLLLLLFLLLLLLFLSPSTSIKVATNYFLALKKKRMSHLLFE